MPEQKPKQDDAAAKARIEQEKAAAQDGGEFRVVCAGTQYRLPSAEHATEFAMRGALITLDDAEALRLIGLDCVVPKGDPDPEPMLVASDNPDNPYGGIPQISPLEHARRVMADEHAKAAAASAVQAQ